MYDIEISKNELDIIFMALRDSKERLNQQTSKLSCSYSELPENLKFLWKDKEAYKEYADNSAKECFRQLDEISKLEEKLEKIL